MSETRGGSSPEVPQMLKSSRELRQIDQETVASNNERTFFGLRRTFYTLEERRMDGE